MNKRIFALIAITVFAVGLVVAGCKKAADKPADQPKTEDAAKEEGAKDAPKDEAAPK